MDIVNKSAGPYYALLVIMLIFIFLWFFIGGKECEFVGLKPLDPDYIMDYTDSYYSPIKYKKSEPENENICVDDTPELPAEFTKQVCIPNNKFLSKGEKICKETMEKIYGVPFKNTRPSWLKNDKTGRNLELDCYNEKLKIAIEYSGIQHYVYPNKFHRSIEDFREQQRRDKLKIKLCKEQGVHLIIVHYNVPLDAISTYITHQLPEIVKQRIKNESIL